ncbi:MAG: hypothetical protein ACIAQZ_02620 [Sedimentisphaeraceae bacterium JB056]
MSSQLTLLAVNIKLILRFSRFRIHYLALLLPAMVFSAIYFAVENNRPTILIGAITSFVNNIVFAFIVSDLIKDVASKPISVSLPGYRELPVKIVLVMGVLINLLHCTLLVVANGGVTWPIITVFAFGVFVYANLTVLALRCMSFFILLGSGAALFGVLNFIDGYSIDEKALFFQSNGPWMSVAMLAASWWMISKVNYMLIPKIIQSWELEQLYEQLSDDESDEGFDKESEVYAEKESERSGFRMYDFLHGLMERSDSAAVKYALAITMESVAFISISPGKVIIALLVLIIISAMDMATMFSIKFLAVVIMFYNTTNAAVSVVRCPLLLTCGRRERLKGVLLAGVFYSTIITLLFLMAGLIIAGLNGLFALNNSGWLGDKMWIHYMLQFKYFVAMFFLCLILFMSCVINLKRGHFVLTIALMISPWVYFTESILKIIIYGLILYSVLCLVAWRCFLKHDRKISEVIL